MKKLFFLFLALVATTTLWAHDFVVDGIYYNYLEDNNVEVTYRGDYYGSYDNEYSGEVTIPSTVTYNGTTYSVTSIGYQAFRNCSSLTSITIPNSVTSIEKGTFQECVSLTSIIIPESVTSIGDYAFYWCDVLASVTIPNSVTSIGDYAFCGCYSLTSITIPNSVTSIGYSAFSFCDSLRTVICEAVEVPELEMDVFSGTPLSYVTLYVHAQSLDDYKAADQWKDFGRILPLEEAPSAVENTRLPIANGAKLLRDGQLLILKDNKVYTIMGQEIQ